MKRFFNNRFQKAAMFGLDARIALAVFAALSTITGVALYSAIRQAKAVSLLSDMREVGKAWEQYYLDTGQDLPHVDPDPVADAYYSYELAKLVEDPGFFGWKGPYLPYPKQVEYRLTHTELEEIFLIILTNAETWGGAISYQIGYCKAGKNCSVWVRFSDFDLDEKWILEKIDVMVDAGDGAAKGSFRWHDNTTDYRSFLRYAPIKDRA